MRYWELTLPQKMLYWELEHKVVELFTDEEGAQVNWIDLLLDPNIKSVWVDVIGVKGDVSLLAYKEKPTTPLGELFEISLNKYEYHPTLVEIARQYGTN